MNINLKELIFLTLLYGATKRDYRMGADQILHLKRKADQYYQLYLKDMEQHGLDRE